MTSIRRDGQIEFRFFRPGAADVKVAGNFAAFENGTLEMQPECDGWWSAQAKLAPGEYRFQYLADGARFTDYASHGVEPILHGWTSVLVVPKYAAVA